MSKQNDGGAAFPRIHSIDKGGTPRDVQDGMSIRQWYKGMVGSKLPFLPYIRPEEIAKKCADVADEMIAEDEKTSEAKPDDPLIAFAPEMFEVCEELEGLLGFELRCMLSSPSDSIVVIPKPKAQELYNKIQSIIRKARGGDDGTQIS